MNKSLKLFICVSAIIALLASCRPTKYIISVTGISLDKTALPMAVGEEATITATIFPENATNKSLTWTSDNEIVATVSSKGLVKALKEGSANIKVTTVDGRLTATCVVSVVERQELFGAVDLGLSVKWANMNIGAENSWEHGDYFAWGETSAKDNYNWSSYSLCDGTDKAMTKYCTLSEYGTVDNRTTLEPADDVARVKLGGNWRMPTEAEMDELLNTDNCTWTWTTDYIGTNVCGYIVQSKKSGYTDKSIFLSAAGFREGTSYVNEGMYGSYWSSSLDSNRPNRARVVNFFSDRVSKTASLRQYGQTVRAVLE